MRYSVQLYSRVQFVCFIIHNFFPQAIIFTQLLERSLLLYGRKLPSTQTIHIRNQFKVTQLETHHSVKWQLGSGIEDTAYMAAVSRESSCMFGMGNTSSLCIEERLVAFRTITPEMARHISRRTGRRICFCAATMCTF